MHTISILLYHYLESLWSYKLLEIIVAIGTHQLKDNIGLQCLFVIYFWYLSFSWVCLPRYMSKYIFIYKSYPLNIKIPPISVVLCYRFVVTRSLYYLSENVFILICVISYFLLFRQMFVIIQPRARMYQHIGIVFQVSHRVQM